MKHVHHWKIDSPNGTGTLTGRCTKGRQCGMVRTFTDEEPVAWGRLAASKIKAAEAAAKKRERKFVVKP